jgi:hypothetical protein
VVWLVVGWFLCIESRARTDVGIIVQHVWTGYSKTGQVMVVCLSLVLVGTEQGQQDTGIGSIVRLGRRVGLGFGFWFLGGVDG